MSDDESDSDCFGWELLYALYENNLTSKLNFSVVWAHFILIKNGFMCAGLGEDTTFPTHRELRETLPAGWHDHFPCVLRYYYDKKIYMLSLVYSEEDNDVIINLCRPCDKKATVVLLTLGDIKKLTGTLQEIFPKWDENMKNFVDNLITPMVENRASKDIHVQTESTDTASEEIPRAFQRPEEDPFFNPLRPQLVPPHIGRPPGLGVGSADLDPFGGGGGMLFQPPGMGPRPAMPDPFLPPGAVPPGARFDPIMPGRGPRPRPPARGNFPDPDHLPPPGYDDMFS